MAEDGLRVAGWYAQVLKQRPDRVAKVMNFDDPDLVAVADTAERPDKIPRPDRPPCAGGEHEIGVRPGPAHVGAVDVLTFGLELERLADDVQERKATVPSAGFNRHKGELATKFLQLLTD